MGSQRRQAGWHGPPSPRIVPACMGLHQPGWAFDVPGQARPFYFLFLLKNKYSKYSKETKIVKNSK